MTRTNSTRTSSIPRSAPSRPIERVGRAARLVFLALGALAAAMPPARAQTQVGPPGLPPGMTREQMWPAPTAADWKKPCLIHWERTYEDALAVAKETGKPILVCVNMDGEIASEHYAGVRYRQPEIARLYEKYVCVIASVYRHTPRDFDEQGNRIPCPRFGGVTCGEHIAIEPGLFERFMDGRRIAPRHIAVEPGAEAGKDEIYDVYYTWDTDSVFDMVGNGIANRPAPLTVDRGDRSLVDLVASRDASDRTRVEQAYRDGDPAQQRALLDAAVALGPDAPVDLLRLALFGFDADLAARARHALAQADSAGAVDLIADALRVPMDASAREALVANLERMGAGSPRAKTLAMVHRGLARRSEAVDGARWTRALAERARSEPPAYEPAYSALRGERQREVFASQDPAARLELAEAFLNQARDPDADPDFARLLLMDAQRTAREAEELGATTWRTDAVLSIAAYYLGDAGEAHHRAEDAVAAMPPDAPGSESWNAMATLAVFAQARQKAIADAIRAKQDWPPQWLTDVNDAYAILERHPFGSDVHVAAHYDFLQWFKARGQADRVLDAGLARFPDSAALHRRLRMRILAEHGVDGLEPAYAERLARSDASPALKAHAGDAAIVEAEMRRRAGEDAAAVAAFERAIQHYEACVAAQPELRPDVDQAIALALAGRARVRLEHEEFDAAVGDLLASFFRAPAAAATQDGLNVSPVDTAKMLLARLHERHLDDLAARLQAGLDGLDPELLLLPAYEGEGPLPIPTPEERRSRRASRGRGADTEGSGG